MSAPPTTANLPGIYRLFLLYIEPALAIQGAMMCFRSPLWYLSVMSPHANLSHYNPIIQVVFDQLAATYFLFAFNQAVVLRMSTELRVWKAMVFGMLVCDLVHMHATKNALGGWEAQLDFGKLRFYDAFNLAVLYGMAGLRVAFLAGVGIKGHANGAPAGQQKPAQVAAGSKKGSKAKTG